jgi:hypothetical protein
MLAELLFVGALEPGLQLCEHFVERQLLGRIRPAMRERQIRGMAGLHRERHAHELRRHGVERRGFRVERRDFSGVDLR